MTLKEKAKNLPTSPGVYLMKDSHHQIIYVGKAKNLKRRVLSYFQNSKNHSSKTVKLINNIKDFHYILTDTEFEAFMLECKLIQELKPFFNRQMKSPLSYAYIIIKNDGEIRKIEVSNLPINREKDQYFGPFTNKNTAEKAIQGIKDFLKINCSSPASKKSSCLNYTLGLCLGMCIGEPATTQYKKAIERVAALLEGTDMGILEEMNELMIHASEQFDFETAAKYRDSIKAITSLIKQKKVIRFTEENKNIVMLESLNDHSFKVFFIKGNQVLYSEKHGLDYHNIEQLGKKIMIKIPTYFKAHSLNKPAKVSKDEIDEAQIIYRYLKNSHCRYFIIPAKWLDTKNTTNIERELIQLLKE